MKSDSNELLTQADVQQYLQEWQAAKPSIARLAELESDLAFLIAEVSQMSDLSNVPEKYADSEVIATDNVIVSSIEQAPVAWEVTSELEPELLDVKTSEDYAVHLANFIKPRSAQFGWYVVQQEFPQLLNGLYPKLLPVSNTRQQLYSLRVGPFNRNTDAERACNLLKLRNYKCETTRFNGDELISM
ncbi:hypothetical protein GCM10027181_13510 [Rheinheimera gaetbuli]